VGGPTYSMPIKGESSSIQYRLERRVIEFGPLPYPFDRFFYYFFNFFIFIYLFYLNEDIILQVPKI
jgi:hypothetical protein